MLPSAFAFVDLETTGTRAAADRITEIGIVRVDSADAASPRITEWCSLVDPEVPIPPEIQALTGITDTMVKSAPTFSTLAGDVLNLLAGCVFVAHNARFDYGFLKHAFARLERSFAARVLCTVRLSRRLYPDAQGHGLDALIARHALDVTDRHRALGDARALWSCVQRVDQDRPRADVEALWQAVLDRKIDWIVSDHACCSAEQKWSKDDPTNIWLAKSGFGGTEYLLSGVLSEGSKRGMSYNHMAELLSWNPAQRFGLPSKGDIAPGYDADIVIVDPHENFVVRAAESKSEQGYSPFEGIELNGRVKSTFLRGALIYDNGNVVGPAQGKYLRRSEVTPT